MNNVVLHIGLPRTGTTFLQHNVFNNIKNINYCLSPRYSDPIKSGCINLLSQENFSGEPFINKQKYVENRYSLINRFKTLFPDAKIVFCNRNENSMVKSLYAQYIREGGILSFKEFIKYEYDKNFMNIDGYIDHVINAFGKNNVFIYSFEDFRKNNIRYIDEMCSFMNVDIPSYNVRVVNKSFNGNTIRLCRNINKFVKTNYNQKGFVPRCFVNWNRWFS